MKKLLTKKLLKYTKDFMSHKLQAYSKTVKAGEKKVPKDFSLEDAIKSIIKDDVNSILKLKDTCNYISSELGITSLKRNILPTVRFFEFCIDELEKIEDIDTDLIKKFKESINLSDSSKKTHIDSVLELIIYLENSLSLNFEIKEDELRLKAIKKVTHEALSIDEVKQLDKKIPELRFNTNDKYTSLNANRDILLFRIMLYTGFKPTWIQNLKLNDNFIVNNNEVLIRLKNKEWLNLPFKMIKPYFDAYIKLSEKANETDYLFYSLNRPAAIISNKTINEIICNVLLFGGIKNKDDSPEMIRTTCAATYKNSRPNGKQLQDGTIMKILGITNQTEFNEIIQYHDRKLINTVDVFTADFD